MTAQEIIDYLRVHVLRDNAKPYLWDDDLLLMYLNDGYMRFATDTGADVNGIDYTLSLATGEYNYEVSEDIVLVKSLQVVGQANEMQQKTRDNMPAPNVDLTGTPVMAMFDEMTNTIRVYPTPDAAYEVTMRVIADFSALDFTDTPLIKAKYHLGLADWVAHRCFTNNDVDAGNVPLSDKHKQLFGELTSRAKRDFYRFRMGNDATARQNWTGKRG